MIAKSPKEKKIKFRCFADALQNMDNIFWQCPLCCDLHPTEISYSNDQERTQDFINNNNGSWKPTGCNCRKEKGHSIIENIHFTLSIHSMKRSYQ